MRVFGRYALVYIVEGRVRYEDANQVNRMVGRGDVILVFPHLEHTYQPAPDELLTEFWITFEGPVFDRWQASGLIDSTRPVHHAAPVDYWLRRLQAIAGRGPQPGGATPLVQVCRLQLALAEIVSGSTRPTPGRSDEDREWAARAEALLETDLERALNLRDVAGAMGMSYDRFRRRFTALAGVAPARYRSARLIAHACELMQQGSLTDRAIAERLGFSDEFYFSRRFKQITGWSPREYRRNVPTLA
jgi:AraC-like DNA-binding protein